MNRPPAFQFYADDFLAGTFTMSNEERGLYITLLCRQWTQGHVTSDEMARLSSGMAQPLATHVFAKFKESPKGVFKNERMEIEREKQAEFRANRSESGKAGAKARWHSHGTAIAQPMAKHGSPSPSPSPKEKCQPSALSSAMVVVYSKELERVTERIKTIRGTYAAHQDWCGDDIKEYSNLLARKRELNNLLGVKI